MRRQVVLICTIATFALSFASSAEAVTVPVTATSANPIQAVFVDLVNGTSAFITSIEAMVGNLALAITGHTSGSPRAATAGAAAAVGSSPAAADASTEPPVPAPPSPTAPAVVTPPHTIAPPVIVSANIFLLQSTVAQLTHGMKSLTDLFASTTPSSKIESQIAALQSALSWQSANYNTSTYFPLGDGHGLSAASNIGQLSGVTITNANLTASEIPALSYLSLSGGALGGDLVLNGNATTTGNSYFFGNIGIGTSTSDAFALNGSAYLADITPPSITTNRIYSNSGNLYWAGSLLGGGSVGNWTTSGGNVYRTSGSVGIGTTTPSAALSVNGSTAIAGSLSLQNVGTSSLTDIQGTSQHIFNSWTPRLWELSDGTSLSQGCLVLNWSRGF